MGRIYSTSLVFFALVFLGTTSLVGQNCSNKLKYAKQLSDSGRIEQIPSLLENCLKRGFSNPEKIDAYTLLIQSYLFDDNREAAQKAMAMFLADFPEYEAQKTDPVEFVKLFKTFRVAPVWDYGFSAGANLSQVSVIKKYSTQSLNQTDSKYLPNGVGVDLNIHASRYFSRALRLTLGVGYSLQQFTREETGSSQLEKLTYSEKDHWVTMPISICYIPLKKKISPYVFAGAEGGFLLMAKSDITRKNLVDPSISDISLKAGDAKAFRQSFNVWGNVGLGVQYKLTGAYLFAQASYAYELLPFVNAQKRFSDNDRLYYYQYIDDEFKVNRIALSFGYAKLIYRNTKKTTRNANGGN